MANKVTGYEKENLSLLRLCIDLGLLESLTSRENLETRGGYGAVRAKGTFATGKEVRYEFCVGHDPDSSHPNAERLLRASRLMQDLMAFLGVNYSCFAVPPRAIEAPDAEAGGIPSARSSCGRARWCPL